MPSDRVACPLCSKMVSRLNLGAHFLSRAHLNDFLNDKAIKQTLHAFYNCKVLRKEEFDKLPTFHIKDEGFNICLGCKRCYTTDSIRKEKRNHFENHPECCEPFRAALTTLCGPKEVVIADPDALQRENDALKREIERLKKQPVITTPAPIVMTEGGITQEMYDEVVREKEAAEEESEQMMAFRRLWKEFLPGAFAGPADIPLEISEIKDFLARRKEAAAAPEPPKPKPKIDQAKVEAFVEANINHDRDGMCSLGALLTTEESAEATKRLAAHYSKPKPAPAPAPAFQPPPLNPPVLTSTLKRKFVIKK